MMASTPWEAFFCWTAAGAIVVLVAIVLALLVGGGND